MRCLVHLCLLQLLCEIYADFEQTCTVQDYYRRNHRNLSVCGERLSATVFRRCGGRPYLGEDANAYSDLRARRRRDIFVKEEVANAYLRTKRNVNTGIVCECCIHTCTPAELSQYCQHRRKRSVATYANPIIESSPVVFTSEEVRELYHEIDRQGKQTGGFYPDAAQLKLIYALDNIKKENIEKKHEKVFFIQNVEHSTSTAELPTSSKDSSNSPSNTHAESQTGPERLRPIRHRLQKHTRHHQTHLSESENLS